jgi:hypothetical protein
VRGSLRDIAVGRLGRTDSVVTSSGFFREALADDLRAKGAGTATAPPVIASGFATHETSGRRAAGVLVYGVDERFWQFHGQPSPEGVVISPALAAELGAAARDVLLVRLQKPSAIPLESLFGRKDDVGRTVRLDVAGVQPNEANRALSNLWARSRIAELSDYGSRNVEADKARQITALGLKYSLLTQYTSFIAVLEQVRNPLGSAEDVDQPLPLPLGVSDLAVGEGTEVGSEPELVWLVIGSVMMALIMIFRGRRRRFVSARVQ